MQYATPQTVSLRGMGGIGMGDWFSDLMTGLSPITNAAAIQLASSGLQPGQYGSSGGVTVGTSVLPTVAGGSGSSGIFLLGIAVVAVLMLSGHHHGGGR